MMVFISIIYWIGGLLLIILGLLLAYAVWLGLGALIPAHPNFEPTGEGVDIYLHTNGMHVSFILPAKHSIYDWTTIILPELFEIKGSTDSFLSFGWGDKSIYLDIAEWNELTAGLAFRTLFLPTTPLLHINAHQGLPTSNIAHTRISATEYTKLCDYIFKTFSLDESKRVKLVPGRGYTPNDQFYEAKGKYHAFNTCNTWANRGLKRIGVRTAHWTSVDRAIFYQFNKIKSIADREMVLEKSSV